MPKLTIEVSAEELELLQKQAGSRLNTEKVVALGLLLMKAFEKKLETLNPDSEEAQCLSREIIFTINQRIIDLKKT